MIVAALCQQMQHAGGTSNIREASLRLRWTYRFGVSCRKCALAARTGTMNFFPDAELTPGTESPDPRIFPAHAPSLFLPFLHAPLKFIIIIIYTYYCYYYYLFIIYLRNFKNQDSPCSYRQPNATSIYS